MKGFGGQLKEASLFVSSFFEERKITKRLLKILNISIKIQFGHIKHVDRIRTLYKKGGSDRGTLDAKTEADIERKIP